MSTSATMPATRPAAEQRVRLSGVAWPRYLAMMGEDDDHSGRFAYDNGELEITNPLLDLQQRLEDADA